MTRVLIFSIVVVSLVLVGLVLADTVAAGEKKVVKKFSDEEINVMMNECNQTYKIEMDYLISLNESGSFPDETDKTPKCFLHCIYLKSGVINEANEFDLDVASEAFQEIISDPKIDVREITSKCIDERIEKCRCEKSYELTKCVLTKVLE